MTAINFVPDDYVQRRELWRTNLMYFALFAVFLAAIAGVFGVLKIRQSLLNTELDRIDKKMLAAQESIKQLEQLQQKRKSMMHTAMLTAELIEPVPRSVLLAELTNSLPNGATLLKLNLKQKKATVQQKRATIGKYEAAQAAKTSNGKTKKDDSPQPARQPDVYETVIEIEGLASSDIEVAGYIANLNVSPLLDNVGLVSSREHEAEGLKFRQFKLTATLRGDVRLTKDDIDKIRYRPNSGAENAMPKG